MANKALFQSRRGAVPQAADAVNEAGGLAFNLTPRLALAQLAATGCLGSAFYADAAEQLGTVLALCNGGDVTPEYVAKVAVYARERGYMKDMPALLLAWLRNKDAALFVRAFGRVVGNGKMLRNLVQVLRSGQAGAHRSLNGTAKRMIRGWLAARDAAEILRDSVGESPSLADIVKLARPKPADESRRALYGWLIGKVAGDDARLPAAVREYEAFKRDPAGKPVPDVPMQMLTSLALSREQWAEVARAGRWHQTRINLQAYLRHGVFDVDGMAEAVAAKLRDPDVIRKAKVFPYQALVAYLATTGGVAGARGKGDGGKAMPSAVTEALQDALDLAIENVPALDGQRVVVFPDVSGSMASPITGRRGVGQDSVVRCVDVAALIAAAFLRKNPGSGVIPFDTQAHEVALNPRDSVATNAQKLAKYGGGGTNCAAPLRRLNERREAADLLVYVSDLESWADRGQYGPSTGMADEWSSFKARNPKARLVCIDLQAYTTTQAPPTRPDTLHVGGFSDAVFEVIAAFAKGDLAPEAWAAKIEEVAL